MFDVRPTRKPDFKDLTKDNLMNLNTFLNAKGITEGMRNFFLVVGKEIYELNDEKFNDFKNFVVTGYKVENKDMYIRL